jgi:hypothetical protein
VVVVAAVSANWLSGPSDEPMMYEFDQLEGAASEVDGAGSVDGGAEDTTLEDTTLEDTTLEGTEAGDFVFAEGTFRKLNALAAAVAKGSPSAAEAEAGTNPTLSTATPTRSADAVRQ